MSFAPEIRFASSADGTPVAYWIASEGRGRPLVMIYGHHFHSLELEVADPTLSSFYERLSQSRPLVRYDRRGIGLSGEVAEGEHSLERHIDDLTAVIDAVTDGPVDLWIGPLSSGVGLRYAERKPDRVSNVVMWWVSTWVVADWREGVANRQESRTAVIRRLRDDPEVWAESLARLVAGNSAAGADLYARFMLAAKDDYPHFQPTATEEDPLPAVPRIACPVLIFQPGGMRWRPEDSALNAQAARRLASELPDARLRLLPETSGLAGFQDVDEVLEVLGRFLETASHATVPPTSAFSTILFTDVVSSTPLLSQLRDERMRAVMRDHDAVCEAAITGHGGRVVKTIGDAFMAEFSVPSAAIDAAIAIQRGVREQFADSDVPIRLRIGINAGEPIVEDDDLHGASVVIAKRLESAAETGGIWVSDVVRQAVAGKDFTFEDRGEVELKGFEQPVRAWAVDWSR